MTASLLRLHPRNLKHAAIHLQRLVARKLWAQILAGMVGGIGAGVMLGPSAGWVSPRLARVIGDWLALPGMLFLSLIQMIVIPLVVTAIVRGIAGSTDAQQLKKNGLFLGGYFVVTTIVATTIGIALASVVQPGRFVDPAAMEVASSSPAPELEGVDAGPGVDLASLPDDFISVFPTNPLLSMVEGQMLQLVLFSVLIGLALLGLRAEAAKPILDLAGSLQELTMKIVGWAMRIAPLAVFGLLARQMASTGLGALLGLAAYIGTFLAGMLILLGVYLLIVRTMGDGKPLRFLRGSRDALLLAFSTDSSAATMPVTIRVAEENLEVRPSIAGFVIPIGASMNMGGTALYQGLATLFMAQIYDMDLAMGALLALVVTSLGASIGTPAAPGVGIVVLATVLGSAGVPMGAIGLILGVDQVLERFRTVLNVSGDLAACTVIERRASATRPREHELAEAAKYEQMRQAQHIDVIVSDNGEHKAAPSDPPESES
jgi:Na+/H+-dicarboxylate symporter